MLFIFKCGRVSNSLSEVLKMDEISDLQIVYFNSLTALVVLHFFVAVCLAFILREYYRRCAAPLANLSQIAELFPFLTGVTFIVIFIVKSSLALSLGLVGALSIVRFRTPIKDPEELVFIFASLALGLGGGCWEDSGNRRSPPGSTPH